MPPAPCPLSSAPFPPPGWLTNREAAAMLGVKPSKLTANCYKYQQRLRAHGRLVRLPNGGVGKIYPRDAIERLQAEQAEALQIQKTFPPTGWLTSDEAAARLGVVPGTLKAPHLRWREMLRGHYRLALSPNARRTRIYRRETIERLAAEQAEARKPPAIPEGFVDKDGAAGIMGVSWAVWQTYVREGKVTFGQTLPLPPASSLGKEYAIYARADVERFKEEMFGAEAIYRDGKTWRYHVPAGFVTRREAWKMFGVSISIWERWESEGAITGGRRLGSGPKVYRVEDIRRLLDENGKLSPPYPDPEHPGVYRVPLAGRDIKRREALIDAGDLRHVAGRSCVLCGNEESPFVAVRVEEGRWRMLRRLIMGVRRRKLNVRHVNGDPLDCRRENLVLRTNSEKVRNHRKVRHINGRRPTSQFKGVCWDARAKLWLVQIRAPEKQRRVGHFESEIAAAWAYDDAARECFGEHARLNFPDGGPAVAPPLCRALAAAPLGAMSAMSAMSEIVPVAGVFSA